MAGSNPFRSSEAVTRTPVAKPIRNWHLGLACVVLSFLFLLGSAYNLLGAFILFRIPLWLVTCGLAIRKGYSMSLGVVLGGLPLGWMVALLLPRTARAVG